MPDPVHDASASPPPPADPGPDGGGPAEAPSRRRRRTRAFRLGVAAAGVLAAAAAVLVPANAATPTAPSVVRTTGGQISGVADTTGGAHYLGIPYAAPPTGSLRWKPPQNPAPWQGVRDGSKFGNQCPQPASVVMGEATDVTSEDCLYVNVYTPPGATSTSNLPVMVWFHGGAFLYGSGNTYDGSQLAAKGHVIVVTVNYRLGIFGFLGLASLDKENLNSSSGNYGLMDQQAALRWVQANARAFGGNGHNVTIFGESAGGASVCEQMASPTAAGLFQKAIAESGCVGPAGTKQSLEQTGASLATKLGCPDAATAATCLRGKSAQDLVTAETPPQDTSSLTSLAAFGPVAEGPVLPVNPVVAYATGFYWHVPAIIGTNHDEARFFVMSAYNQYGKTMTADDYTSSTLQTWGPGWGAKILAEYPLSAYASPALAYGTYTSDVAACLAVTADNLVKGPNVYVYEFADENAPDWYPIKLDFPLGAAHSTELQYVFDSTPGSMEHPPFTDQQQALADQMIGYWSRLAATGNPNGGGAPQWQAFNGRPASVQSLAPGATGPAVKYYTDHRCSFWATLSNGKSTPPTGTTPGGTAPSGTAPSGTTPSGTTPAGTAPSGTAPSGTAPSGTTGTVPADENTVPSDDAAAAAASTPPMPGMTMS